MSTIFSEYGRGFIPYDKNHAKSIEVIGKSMVRTIDEAFEKFKSSINNCDGGDKSIILDSLPINNLRGINLPKLIPDYGESRHHDEFIKGLLEDFNKQIPKQIILSTNKWWVNPYYAEFCSKPKFDKDYSTIKQESFPEISIDYAKIAKLVYLSNKK